MPAEGLGPEPRGRAADTRQQALGLDLAWVLAWGPAADAIALCIDLYVLLLQIESASF